MKLNIKNIVEVQKIPYSGCSILQEEMSRISTTLYGGAYSAPEINAPLQTGTLSQGGKYDPFDFNFKYK